MLDQKVSKPFGHKILDMFKELNVGTFWKRSTNVMVSTISRNTFQNLVKCI